MSMTRMTFAAAAAAAVASLVAGCSADTEPAPVVDDTPVSYLGEWTEKDGSAESWQEAVVTDGRIEVYWMTPDTKSLYWAGTFEAECDGTKVSENDKEATGAALLASGADTKDFECAEGEIAYDVTAMGVTKTVHLVRK